MPKEAMFQLDDMLELALMLVVDGVDTVVGKVAGRTTLAT